MPLFSYKGRISRLRYLFSVTFLSTVCIILMYGGNSLYEGEMQRAYGEGRSDPGVLLRGWVILSILLVFGAFIVFVWAVSALTVRRLHDMDLSGKHAWWIYALSCLTTIVSSNFTKASIIPIGTLCWGVNTWLVISRGTNGSNRFGPSQVPAGNRPNNRKVALIVSFCIGAAIQIVVLRLARQTGARGPNEITSTKPEYVTPAKPVTSASLLDQIGTMSFMLREPGADESRIVDGVAASMYEYLHTTDDLNDFSSIEQVFSSDVRESAKSLALDANTKPRAVALVQRLLNFQHNIIGYYDQKAAPILKSTRMDFKQLDFLVERKAILDDYANTQTLLSVLQETPTTK